MRQIDYIYSDGELYLFPFRENDINDETYRSWFTNPDVTRYNSHRLFPMTQDSLKSFVGGLHKEHIVFKIVIVSDSEIPEIKLYKWIGNCSLQSFNWINRSAEFAIVIGEVNSWGKGYGTRCLNILLEHGFNRLNLHRIWTGTADTNKGMQLVALESGMKLEGLSREGMYLDGKYVDVCHYGILRSEWNENKS